MNVIFNQNRVLATVPAAPWAPRQLPARAMLAAAMCLALRAWPAHAATFIVTDAGDNGPGTLRQAVNDAMVSASASTISFDLPAGSTIILTSGDMELTGPDLSILGPGRDLLTISGGGLSRIFHVQTGNLSISALTLRNGLALGDDSNESDQRGGAILVGAPVDPPAQAPPPPGTSLGLELSDVAVLDSQAYSPLDGGGGGVFSQNGDITIDRCVLDGNFARRTGAALTTRYGTVAITDSRFTNNTVDFSPDENSAEGGGILINRSGGSISRSIVRGNTLTDTNGLAGASGGSGIGAGLAVFMQLEPFSIADSEFSDNTNTAILFSIGGGIQCHQEVDGTAPTLSLVNSTISGNTGDYGVGIEAGCSVALTNSTIANNTSTNYYGDGGHPGVEAYSPNTTEQTQITLVSSLVAGNLGGGADIAIYHADGYADPAFIGSNALVQIVAADVTLPSDTIIGVDPLLSALAYNGGSTRTHALQTGSVAIDAGSNPDGLAFDQRGAPFSRDVGIRADIGAFELDPDRVFANGFD